MRYCSDSKRATAAARSGTAFKTALATASSNLALSGVDPALADAIIDAFDSVRPEGGTDLTLSALATRELASLNSHSSLWSPFCLGAGLVTSDRTHPEAAPWTPPPGSGAAFLTVVPFGWQPRHARHHHLVMLIELAARLQTMNCAASGGVPTHLSHSLSRHWMPTVF